MTSHTGSRRHGFLRRNAGKLAASAVITASVLYAVRKGGLKLVPDGGDFGAVRWWAVALYFAIVLAMTWFRSVRWRFLLRSLIEVPNRRLFAVSCAGFAAILLLPFRLGEFARPYLLRTRSDERRTGAPVLTMTAATGSIVAERVIDGVFLSAVLAIVLVLVPTVHPLPAKVAWVRTGAFLLLGVFIAGLVTIMVFYFARAWAHRATHAVIGRLSPRLAEVLAGVAEKLADGFHVFGRGRDALGFLAETAVYWSLNAVAMWVLAIGCGVVHGDGSPIALSEACGIMGMLGCAILIPGPPGLFGTFQAGIYAGMMFYFPAEIVTGPGAAYVFLLYGSQVVFHLVTGAWGLWYEGGTRRIRGALVEPPLAVDATEPPLVADATGS